MNAPGTVISVDAMGGDRGPSAVMAGLAISAQKNADIRFIVHGDEEALSKALRRRPDLAARCDLRHAESVISMTDRPSQAMRNGKGSSMWSALTSVSEGEADVAVSLGNTGALMALSMLRLRTAPGVDRPAIAVFWPSRRPKGFTIVLDVGANVSADAGHLRDFALMGAEYARLALEEPRPRVGLLNIGSEDKKGRRELQDASALIAAAAKDGSGGGFDYAGFVEGGDISRDVVDVVVTDGFTGNIALKTAEGTASFIRDAMGDAFRHSPLSRLGALFALTSLRRLRKRIDPRRVNGGVFLGLGGAVVKSHGGADATGVAAAVKLAFRMGKADFARKVAARVAAQPHPAEGGSDAAAEAGA